MTLKICVCYDMFVAEVFLVENEEECKKEEKDDIFCVIEDIDVDVG
jgi:hypothetical protein